VIVVVVALRRRIFFRVLKFNPIIVNGSSKSLVVGLQPHRDALTEATRIPASVEINKNTSEAEQNDDQ
jgi:hypothetical protein